MNKNKYSVRCLHHLPPFTLQISYIYIYMFPKVASNAGCLPFWLPISGENGLISRCAEKLQFAVESVGPVAAQQISTEAFKSWSTAGLLQTLCRPERTLTKKKGAKELKWLHFLCRLPWAAPNNAGNLCWRRSWMPFTEPWPCPSSPSTALAPQPKPQGSSCSILFWAIPDPKKPRACAQTPAHFSCWHFELSFWQIWAITARCWCRSAPLASCGICMGSSDFALIPVLGTEGLVVCL